MKPFTACKLSVPCSRIRMTLLLEVKLSVVIHWITKQNGKAIRVRNWSNSVIALVFGLPYKGTKKFWIMQYPDASVCAARRNYFRRHTQISESVHVFICTFYRKSYALQITVYENANWRMKKILHTIYYIYKYIFIYIIIFSKFSIAKWWKSNLLNCNL